jgi:hypothetical protein
MVEETTPVRQERRELGLKTRLNFTRKTYPIEYLE